MKNKEVRVKVKRTNYFGTHEYDCVGTVVSVDGRGIEVAGVLPNGDRFSEHFPETSVHPLSDIVNRLRNS